MGKNKFCQYYVEGETEKQLIKTLKTEFQCIIPGKVETFNATLETFTKAKIIGLKMNTTIILVIDTDAGNPETLRKNINFLKNQSNIKNVICVTQVKNLEDELKRSCNLRQIREFTKSKSNSEFKRDLLKMNNLHIRLLELNFQFSKFWIRQPDGDFKCISNEASKIKSKITCF